MHDESGEPKPSQTAALGGERKTYREGFSTQLPTDELDRGISERVVRTIAEKRGEPEWMLNFRLHAYRSWLKMREPHWLKAHYEPIDYGRYVYYSAPLPRRDSTTGSYADGGVKDYLTEEVEKTFDRLGVPVREGKDLAVDAIFDSVSVSTTYQAELAHLGIIFCSFSEAIRSHAELTRRYLGSVVPADDNFFSALNSAVASDGTFVYIPEGVDCPTELSTYFRMNSTRTGQFERTIIVADRNSSVSYVEGCSAPSERSEHQLHAAVVEVILLENARVRYSTVQNWFAGDGAEKGILNFVTKRAVCAGHDSRMSWIQSETGSAITWKYPSVILKGDRSVGEFYSVAFTSGNQQADTGTKMIHIGRDTRSTIMSKGISAGSSSNTYRGLVKILPRADGARNFTQCDSMMIGDGCSAHTLPRAEVGNGSARLEHEASVSQVGEDQLLYCKQRGIDETGAVSMVVNGFCSDVFSKLPLEFAAEAQKLLAFNIDRKYNVG